MDDKFNLIKTFVSPRHRVSDRSPYF